MAASLLLDTDDVAARDRPAQWSEWIGQLFSGLRSDLYGDTAFDGRMAASHAGDVILTRLDANRHRVFRDAGVPGGERAYLKIVAPWQGTATVRQLAREATAQEGSWIVYDTTEAYQVDNPGHVEHLIVMVPKDSVAERGLRLESVMGRRLGTSGISRVALATMRHTYQELPCMGEAAARGAGELIEQLVRLSLLEAAGKDSAASQREALRDRICLHVQQHLRDPDLSVDSIARALNCSRRHLYNAFAGEGEPIAAYIQRQRLAACIRELQSEGKRPITDIAMSWGFGNPSHFSRVFRGHTGMSPSEFRHAPGLSST